MTLTCVVHYKGKGPYEELRPLSDNNKARIIRAKDYRLTLSEENKHEEQCSMVPDVFIDDKHGVHLDTCYKKFTLILSKLPNTSEQSSEPTRKSTRQSLGSPRAENDIQPRVLFPKTCFICNRNRIQRKKKDEYPVNVTTMDAQLTIKAASREKMERFYYEIKDDDLIARELRYHKSCYRSFVLGFTQSFRQVNTTNVSATASSSTQNDADTNNQQVGNYEAVQQYINEHIFEGKKTVSISVLHDVYGINTNDTRYRSKLKQRIQNEFKDRLTFFSVSHKTPELIMDSSVPASEINFQDKTGCIVKAAKYIRQQILSSNATLPKISWPPVIEELEVIDRNIPSLLCLFIRNVLYSVKENKMSEISGRLTNSISSDIFYNTMHGTILTKKHYLLALGVHNITGQRKVVDILNKFGHCISYKQTCDIETALALKAQVLAKESSALPLIPNNTSSYVLTVFWVDNFDIKVERQTGSSSIHTTHLVAFQEQDENCTVRTNKVSVDKNSKISQLKSIEQEGNFKVNVKAEPYLPLDKSYIDPEPIDYFKMFFYWVWMRKHNSFDQQIPSYSGWLLRHRSSKNLVKTTLTYLPPINSKVNEFSTIATYMRYLQKLSLEVNMPYVNITLDVGAAVNAFKTLWSNQEMFKNVIVHLGDFHFMKENFLVIGNLISGSGWEDIVFESGLSSSGSLMAVIMATQYNKAWTHHIVISEAFERLLVQRYAYDFNLQPDALPVDPDIRITENIMQCVTDASLTYENYRQNVRAGSLGKTAQFWVLYLDLIRMQHVIHTAVQENDYEMRLKAWEYFIPFYFALNKTNYARYGSYYLEFMKSLENNYPGLKDMLKTKGISVQGQDRYPIRTAIDQRGEQTINRDAKTAGGVKSFSTREESVLKWCLNRSEQAQNTRSLEELCNIRTDNSKYKPSRPSEILKSEKLVQKVITVIQEDYINPFGLTVDKEKLVCLSSGVPLIDEVTNDILSLHETGKKQHQTFVDERLKEKSVTFHTPIKRNPVKTFKFNVKKTITKNNKTIEVNRDILSKLLSIAIKQDKKIDFEKSLEYPLSEVPLSICNADGSMRKTCKSKLSKAILSRTNSETPPRIKKEQSAFIIDLMALIRTVSPIPDTFEELALQLLLHIPKGHYRVDIIADSYLPNSIKFEERAKRGSSDKVTIKSSKSKIPREFSKFLSNGENKLRMIEIIFQVLEVKKVHVLNSLRTTKLVLSRFEECKIITLSSCDSFVTLVSNHEEADTKVITHAIQFLQQNTDHQAIIRSPSGDTDIIVLAVALLFEFNKRVSIDNGTGKERKVIWLGNIDLSQERSSSLIGLHAFTGNDYASSFFKKGKDKCWKLLLNYRKFEDCFVNLGVSPMLSNELFVQLEEFVCYLYGIKCTSVNEARWQIFEKKHKRENKIPDLSLLPPCQDVLHYHAKRANLVAYIWRKSYQSLVDIPDISENGWFASGEIMWLDEAFPSDVEEMLENDKIDEDDELFYGSDVESEDDSDDDYL